METTIPQRKIEDPELLHLKSLNESQIIDWLKNKLRKGIDLVKVKFLKPGVFYTMSYNSKLFEENKIKFFDKQPLILLLDRSNGYSLGLNFNYLPINKRKAVINRLENRYPEQWDKNNILPNLQWSNIAKEVDYAEAMVHVYIENRISKIVKIKNTHMKEITNIDSSEFVGISPEEIWKQLKI